ncbi:translocation/assembly module TamB domain-containing protein [Alkalimonas delamerensis]|uniref:Translocation/assembly module TamB domain-containing protein n=1 Tax=Alkalimonas delamerensis TaxID=265981 RepID=A0ABT9GP33_9GAMM|nr:translocation/assembly module TamB domain-containing protein [Alkalimonas delamerensis]MDP4528416.1 translocation/assembly module TamB domain-containing protein [Alkalimonas delamerensis]
MTINKGFWYSLLLFVLLTVVLAFSQPGLRFNLWVLERLVPELQVAKAEGNLLNGFQLQQLRYQQEGLLLSVEQLSVNNHLPCLFSLSLCLRELRLQGVQVQLDSEPSTDSAAPQELALPQVWIPFPISIRQFELSDMTLQLNEQQIQLSQLNSSLELWGNRLVLQPTKATRLALSFPTEPAEESTSATEPTALLDALAWPGLQLPDLLLPLQIDLVEFDLQQLYLNEARLLDALKFGLLVDRRSIQLIDLSLRQHQLELNANLKLQPQQQYPLDASFRLFHPDLLSGPLQVTAAITGDLAALQAELSIDGALDATAAAAFDLISPQLPFSAQLQSAHLQWPLETEAQYQLRQSQLQLAGTLEQWTAQLRTELQGDGLPDSSIQLEASMDTKQLALHQLRLATLGGQIQAQGVLQLQDRLQWRSQWQFEQLDPGLQWPEYPGLVFGSSQLDGELTAEGGWALELAGLQLSGWLRDIPLRLDGQVRLEDPTGSGALELTAKPVRLHHGQNQLELAGTLTDAWQMLARVQIADLADSVPDSRGQLEGSIALSGARETPELQLDIAALELGWQQLFSLQSARLQGSLNTEQPIQTELDITLSDLRLQQLRFDSLQLALHGDERQHHLQLALDGEQLGAELRLAGQYDRQQQRWLTEWQEAWFSTELGRWELRYPMQLAVHAAEPELHLSAHCWQRELASLCLPEDSRFSIKQAAVKLSLENFELAWLSPWLPPFSELSGRLNAQSELNWQQDAPLQARLQLQSPEGRLGYHYEQELFIPWHQLALQAELIDQQFAMNWQAGITEQGSLQGQIQLSELDSDHRQLAADIEVDQFSFEFLQPLLDDFSQLNAVLNSQIRLEGPLQQPSVTGHLRVQDVSVRGQMSPVDIERGELSIDFNSDSAQLQGFVQTPQGEVQLQGDSQWADLAAWSAQLGIRGDALSVQIPLGRLQLQPDLTLTANPERALLSGTVDIPWARLVVDSLPEAAVSISRDEVLVDADFNPLQETTDSRTLPFHTDIRVRLGDQVRFAAFGLRSHIRGSLQVRQDSAQPRLYGELNLVDGTFRSYGQDLLIRRGQVLFSGPADQPFLNLEAIRNPDNIEDDVIAGIRVSGPADEPNIQIFSEPAMAQANATSYLLLGRNLDSESGSAANPVTTSLIGLGLATSSRLVGSLGEAFGVQDLTLDTAGTGDQSQVTVSGYLTRNLQVKYGVGIFEPFGEFTLRYRLMRNLYLESVTGLEQSVDLLYRFEFD